MLLSGKLMILAGSAWQYDTVTVVNHCSCICIEECRGKRLQN